MNGNGLVEIPDSAATAWCKIRAALLKRNQPNSVITTYLHGMDDILMILDQRNQKHELALKRLQFLQKYVQLLNSHPIFKAGQIITIEISKTEIAGKNLILGIDLEMKSLNNDKNKAEYLKITGLKEGSIGGKYGMRIGDILIAKNLTVFDSKESMNIETDVSSKDFYYLFRPVQDVVTKSKRIKKGAYVQPTSRSKVGLYNMGISNFSNIPGFELCTNPFSLGVSVIKIDENDAFNQNFPQINVGDIILYQKNNQNELKTDDHKFQTALKPGYNCDPTSMKETFIFYMNNPVGKHFSLQLIRKEDQLNSILTELKRRYFTFLGILSDRNKNVLLNNWVLEGFIILLSFIDYIHPV